jgi:hypothetical protein
MPPLWLQPASAHWTMPQPQREVMLKEKRDNGHHVRNGQLGRATEKNRETPAQKKTMDDRMNEMIKIAFFFGGGGGERKKTNKSKKQNLSNFDLFIRS